MKNTPIIPKIAIFAAPSLVCAISLLTVSCGAPDATVQKEMDKDIMSAGQKKGAGATVGPKYMEGSRGYGLGSY